MPRVSEDTIIKLNAFIKSLPEEARSKCALCNETLTHLVKLAEVQTGAGTATVTRALSEAINEDAAPGDRVSSEALRGRVQREERPICTNHADNSQFRTSFTGENEWYTPVEYIEAARKVLGCIDLDPATSEFGQSRVLAQDFFTKDDDGLKKEWNGRVWLNPPYSQPLIGKFIEKAISELDDSNIDQMIILTHNYTDTAWFHLAESRAACLCFTKGRIRFESSDGKIASPTQGQCFFYYGDDGHKFEKIFRRFGFVR